LRTRRERPYGCAAQHRYKLTTFRLIELHRCPQAGGSRQDTALATIKSGPRSSV
jgi:hypothetical protein